MNTKVSIIGSNGFLSTSIGRYSNQEGWVLDMYGLDKPTCHQYDNFYQVDLMTEDLNCEKLLDSDIIIYAAGAGIQSNLRDDRGLIYRLNIMIPVALCNSLKQLGYKGIFITFGSYFEIGEVDSHKAYTEEDMVEASSTAPNDYIISKRMLSCFVSSYKHDFVHWHFYLPTIYGERENPVRLIPYTINAIKNNQPLHFTSGDQIRQYIYVDEVPEMIAMAYKKKLKSGIYNVEGTQTLSVRDIVDMIHSVMGAKLPEGCFGSANRDDVGMKYLALDGTKLKEAIGFEPVVVLRDVISKYE